MSENNENSHTNEKPNNNEENENVKNSNDKENDNNEIEKNEIKNNNIIKDTFNEENKTKKESDNIENNNKIDEDKKNIENIEKNKKEEIKHDKNFETPNEEKQLNEKKNIEPIDKEYKEESINKNILDEYKDISPIDFVGIIENNYEIFLPNSLESQLHQLSTYKAQNLTNKLKFNLLNIINSETLYNRMIKNNLNISLLKNLGKYFFIGYNNGKIHIIHLEKNDEIYLESEDAKVSVTSLDIYNDYLITGYKNGIIILWDYKNKKILHSIKNSFKTEITALKFIECIPKKKYEFFVADLEGNLVKMEITIKLLFNTNISSKGIYKEKNNPTYIIKIFNLEDKKINLVTFATRDSIKVYMLTPTFQLIDSDNKPDYISDKNLQLPDIDFGYGYLPKNQKTKHAILAISWDKIINFYGFFYSSDNSLNYFICHYINNESIVKIGFIDTSIMFIIDNSNKIKLINTAFTSNGEFKYDKNKENNFILTEKAILEEGKLIENNLLKSIIKIEEKEYNIYNNYIIYEKKMIYILAESKIYIIKLLNFENCLNDLINNKKWLDALNLGIDLYQGNITSLPDIPNDENLRNKILLPLLMNLLNKYIDYNFLGNDNNSLENLEKCMNISIEFCLSIKLINFLFFDVIQTFAQKGKSDEFIKKIQPFIFKDKLIKEEISNALPSLYVTYKTKNELSLFDHLLTHLNFNNINTDIIKRFSVIDNLFTVMIYTYENSNDYKDLFFPIVKMYKRFNEINYDVNEDYKTFFSYVNLFKKKNLEKMINSKEYIGHKLLWYIDLCLLEKKYFLKKDFENESFLYFINNDNYKKFISLIYIFLLQKEIILNLIKFDSYNYFNILSKFFLDEKLKDIINNEKFDINIYYDIYNNFFKLYEKTNKSEETIKKNENDFIKNYYDLKEVLNFIIQTSKSISMFFINQDLNMFLIKIATQKKYLIEKNILLKAVNEIFNFYNIYNNLTDDNEKYDKFNVHKIIIDKYNNIDPNNLYYKEINNSLLNFIVAYENEFNVEDLNEFIKESENTPFIFPKIKILELNKVYKECLYIFLNNLDKLGGHEKLFEWINSLFKKITEKIKDENENKEIFKEDLKKLQDSILNILSDLMKISINDFSNVIENWFENDKKLIIIKKLDSEPKLQLKYIEKILSQLNENNNEKKEDDLDSKNNKKIINELILMSIDLLIKINKKNEILNLLKKNLSNFNIDEVKSKCISNDVIDAAVYLYELEGNNIEALNIVINYLKKIYTLINSNQNNEDLNLFNNALNISIQICELNTNQLNEIIENEKEKKRKKEEKKKENEKEEEKEKNESEKLWFNLLELLFNFKEKAEKSNEKVNNLVSDSIDYFLKKMCLYVSIKKILSYVTANYNDVKIKEFKNVLNLMLNSYSNLKSVLYNSKNIFKFTIDNLNKQYKKELYHGFLCEIEYCDYCHKTFEALKRDKIKIYLCGHKVHLNCAGENDEVCVVCSNFYFKIGDDDVKKVKKDKKIKIEEKIDFGSKNLNELAEKISPEKLNLIKLKVQRLNKLKRYEKKYNENSSFLI